MSCRRQAPSSPPGIARVFKAAHPCVALPYMACTETSCFPRPATLYATQTFQSSCQNDLKPRDAGPAPQKHQPMASASFRHVALLFETVMPEDSFTILIAQACRLRWKGRRQSRGRSPLRCLGSSLRFAPPQSCQGSMRAISCATHRSAPPPRCLVPRSSCLRSVHKATRQLQVPRTEHIAT